MSLTTPTSVLNLLVPFFFLPGHHDGQTDKAAEAEMATKAAEEEIPTKAEKPTEVVTLAGPETESEGEDSCSISWITTFFSSSSSEYCPSPPHANLRKR